MSRLKRERILKKKKRSKKVFSKGGEKGRPNVSERRGENNWEKKKILTEKKKGTWPEKKKKRAPSSRDQKDGKHLSTRGGKGRRASNGKGLNCKKPGGSSGKKPAAHREHHVGKKKKTNQKDKKDNHAEKAWGFQKKDLS